MEIAETEANVDTPNTHIHDRSLSRVDTPNTHIHDRSLFRLDTLDCGIKLVLWSQTFLLSGMMLSCKCFYMVFYHVKSRNTFDNYTP